MESKRIKVLFPYVEAGFGHITPLKSMKNAFEKKYGDQYEIVETYFYTQTGNEDLKKFNDLLCQQVRMHNKCHLYGIANTIAVLVFGGRVCNWFCMKAIRPKAYKAGMEYLKSFNCDVVVSTHWATNYYAMKMEDRPLTIIYNPDIYRNLLFEYPADLVLTPSEEICKKVVKRTKFTEDSFQPCAIAISENAKNRETDKKLLQKSLGFDNDNFTICISEGGYGIGRMERIIKKLIKLDKPYNIIAICGRNEDLFHDLEKTKRGKNLKLVNVPLCENIIPYLSACDLYLGKGGANSLAEAVYCGAPMIITGEATLIEHGNAKFYKKEGCALRIRKVRKIVKKIIYLSEHQDELDRMKANVDRIHPIFDSEKLADQIHEFVQTHIKK